jgi:hypothetical protein
VPCRTDYICFDEIRISAIIFEIIFDEMTAGYKSGINLVFFWEMVTSREIGGNKSWSRGEHSCSC